MKLNQKQARIVRMIAKSAAFYVRLSRPFKDARDPICVHAYIGHKARAEAYRDSAKAIAQTMVAFGS